MSSINFSPILNANAMSNFYRKLDLFMDEKFPFAIKKMMPTINVTQGLIVVSSDQLTTSGLLPCSVVATRFKGKNLLGHIDATTNTDYIIKSFNENFDINELKNNPEVKIIIFGGSGNNYISLSKIYYALSKLGLGKEGKVVYAGKVSTNAEVGINDAGVFIEEKLINAPVELYSHNKNLINAFQAYFNPKLNKKYSG